MAAAFYGTLLLLAVIFAAVYLCLKWHYGYWTRRHVPQIRPRFLVGNLGGLLRMQKSPAEFIRDLYNDPQAQDRCFVGVHIFHQPAILVRDPELVKRVLIKDFSKFCDRYSNSDTKGDPMGSQNIFFLKNPLWKEVRLKLSPFFTSGRIKQMFCLVEEVGRNLDAHLLNYPIENKRLNSFCLELKELCALYTTDVIATVAFGVEANTFKNPDGEFRRNGRAVFKFTIKRALEFTLVFFLPHLVPYLKFKVVPLEPTKFLRTTINHVMEKRELSGQSRHDLIDILIEFKNWSRSRAEHQHQDLIFEGDILVAQAALFFTAGFETSSATMSFALYELAKRLDLQQRLREEIRQALIRTRNNVTYKLIDSLDYMQMVIYEVLRLYPPLPFLDRECTVDAAATYSLQPFHSFALPRGMPVYIPVYGLHMDPKYFANPDTFDPERFSCANRKGITPYTYMPFGLGPHACIGERFGILQAKIGLLNFFRNHYVKPSSRTRSRMKLDPKAIITQAEGGIYLNVVRDPLVI